MESLGLQAVTLSDGTTAYIQQAVKGNGFFGLERKKESLLNNPLNWKLEFSKVSWCRTGCRVFCVVALYFQLCHLCGVQDLIHPELPLKLSRTLASTEVRSVWFTAVPVSLKGMQI